MNKLAIPILAVFFFSTCAGSDPAGNRDFQGPFFDLEGYMQGQIDSLQALNPEVRKTIELNSEIETHQLDNLNFKQELKLFQQADINKPAWIDKYEIEERRENDAVRTYYNATDTTLAVQQMMVDQIGKKVAMVFIDRQTGSFLSQGSQTLVYRPTEGYEIATSQSSKVGGEIEGLVVVKFLSSAE
ncbi:MAG: hypothetical protein AAF741_06535 [Bacteroidota bacterium]